MGWHGYSMRQDYHNRDTRSHKKTIDVNFQNHKSNYFLRSLPDPKHRVLRQFVQHRFSSGCGSFVST